MTDVADADSGAEREPDTDAERDGDDPDELVARIAVEDEVAAAEVEALFDRNDELETALEARERTVAEREATIDELESKLKRSRADFQNYKRRAKQREEDVRERATEDLVGRLLDVRDNLVRALEQDDDVEVRDGVEATLSTFDRILDGENVSAIEPDAGEDVEPERHEVVHRTESEHPEGAIADVYRPGYEMAGKVLRPAQVTVSDGTDEDAADAEGSAGEAEDAGASESDASSED